MIDGPLTSQDACCILGLDAVEYELLHANDRIASSVQIMEDVTGRLRFHSFWDLVSYEISRRASNGLSEETWVCVEEALNALAMVTATIPIRPMHLSAEVGRYDGHWRPANMREMDKLAARQAQGVTESPQSFLHRPNSRLSDDWTLDDIDAWVAQIVNGVALAVRAHLVQVLADT